MLYLLLCARYGLRGAVNQLLSLAHIQKRPHSTLQLRPDQPQRFLPGAEGISCDGEFHIEFEKVEIGGGHVADQRRNHGFSVPIGGQQLGARRLRRPAQPAPDVDLVGKKTEENRSKVSPAVSAGNAKCSLPRQLNTGKSTPSAEVWILIRLGDAEISARRIDASHRIPKIVVLDEGGSNQLLELFVREDLEPFEISNRLPVRCHSSAKLVRDGGWRAVVVWTDHTAAQTNEHRHRCDEYNLTTKDTRDTKVRQRRNI